MLQFLVTLCHHCNTCIVRYSPVTRAIFKRGPCAALNRFSVFNRTPTTMAPLRPTTIFELADAAQHGHLPDAFHRLYSLHSGHATALASPQLVAKYGTHGHTHTAHVLGVQYNQAWMRAAHNVCCVCRTSSAALLRGTTSNAVESPRPLRVHCRGVQQRRPTIPLDFPSPVISVTGSVSLQRTHLGGQCFLMSLYVGHARCVGVGAD